MLSMLLSLFFSSARAEALPAPAHVLPEGFCYVHEVIDDVILDMRYAGTHNFVGDPIDGYLAPYAIMTAQATQALKAAAEDFRALGRLSPAKRGAPFRPLVAGCGRSAHAGGILPRI